MAMPTSLSARFSPDRRKLAARLVQFQPVGDTVGNVPRKGRRQTVKRTGLGRPIDKALGIDRATATDERIAVVPAIAAGVLAGCAVAACLSLLLGVSTNLAGAAGLVLSVFGARYVVGMRRDATLARMEEQFALALGVIIRCVRAGLPVVEGMRAVGAEVPEPTGPEFRRCVDQVQLGVDFDVALVGLAERCTLPDYRFFGVTVTLQRQTGGNLAETLDNLAETIRRRRAVRLKAQALTSETRATVAVLAVLPLGVAAAMMVVSPDYILQLFTTASGRKLLGIAMVVQAFGLLVIRIIARKSLA